MAAVMCCDFRTGARGVPPTFPSPLGCLFRSADPLIRLLVLLQAEREDNARDLERLKQGIEKAKLEYAAEQVREVREPHPPICLSAALYSVAPGRLAGGEGSGCPLGLAEGNLPPAGRGPKK